MKKGVLCIVLSALGFALMAACVRLCDDYGGPVSSFQKSFFRNIVALAIAAIVYVEEWKGGNVEKCERGRLLQPKAPIPPIPPISPSLKEWLLLFLRSVFGTVGIFANFYALGRISIAEGQTLNKTAPFFTVIFAWLFLKERAGWKTFLPLLVAFAGVVLIAKPGFAGDAALPLALGLLGGLCAGAAYAALHALGKSGFSPAFIILFFSSFSCLASVPFMLHEFDPMTNAQVAVLFGAGAGAALGQFGVTLAYRFAAPRDVAVYDYSNIIFTAALGFLLFGQIPDALSIAGMALVLAAAVLRMKTTSR
jgi:drug/metabolite transporter (DMT)-like permease